VWARGLTGVDAWLDCKRGSKSTGRSGSRGHCKSGCKGGFVVGHLSYQAVMKLRLLGALVARLSRCWGLSQDTRLLSHRSVG
jgi:hypothetical protein